MFNLVVLTGRLTADPELRYTPSNIPVTTFSIAVSRRYKAGEQAEADFINIVAWNKSAEFICRYFTKGQRIGIEGSIDELTEKLWTSLNEENKVSLFVRYIDIETGEYETRIVNKNK